MYVMSSLISKSVEFFVFGDGFENFRELVAALGEVWLIVSIPLP